MVTAHKCALIVCSNSSVFLTKVSEGLIFGGRHPAWRNLTFAKVCSEDLFATASNYSGTEGPGGRGGMEEENGSCLFKCHFCEVNASSLSLSLSFFKHYMSFSHNGKKTFFAMFYSVSVSLFGSGCVIGSGLWALWGFANILTVTTNHLVVCFV